TVEVTLNPDGSVTVKDDGRGIPADIHPTEKISTIQVVAATLHAGGKFDNDSYKVSSGLHGVGLSVVNALSKKAKIQVFQNGNEYVQEYKEGTPQYDVKVVGKSDKTGTWVTFLPDDKIFTSKEFSVKKILSRM